MSNEVIIYSRAKTGKTKYIRIWTDGAFLKRIWGTFETDIDIDGSIPQETQKECTAMNVGRSNATTAEEQAVVEMQQLIDRKTKEGYRTDITDVEDSVVGTVIDLDNLPKEFCPCKPTAKCPEKILGDKNTYGQRKRNGHCIILVKTLTSVEKVYSRRMEDITEYLADLPIVRDMLTRITKGSMVLTEFCFVKANGLDSPRIVGKVVRKKDKKEVRERYDKYSKVGEFEVVPFDTMFEDGKFIGDIDFMDRHSKLEEMQLPSIQVLYPEWKLMLGCAEEDGWEGFILRIYGEDSHIHFTLNGKADRAGSWKFVFLKEDDFIVTGAAKGKSGKHAGLYAQFNLYQHMEKQNGEMLSCGNCGPGKLTHDRLKELTQEIDSGELEFPFVIQVEFRSRQEDTGKLEFAQFELVRYDKGPDECLTDFLPEED